MQKVRSALMLFSLAGTLLIPVGCQTTTLTYSEKKLLCGTIERVRYRPTRETYATLPPEDQDFLKKALKFYRQECT